MDRQQRFLVMRCFGEDLLSHVDVNWGDKTCSLLLKEIVDPWQVKEAPSKGDGHYFKSEWDNTINFKAAMLGNCKKNGAVTE